MMSHRISRRAAVGGLVTLGISTASAHDILTPSADKDHTALLQTAIDTAQVVGGRLELGAGIFIVQDLRITAPISLHGVQGQTFIQSDGADLLLITGENVVLDGITFVAKSKETKLVSAQDCKSLSITACRFLGGDSGLRLERCSGTVEKCVFEDQETSGLFSNDATGLQISNNTVTGTGNNGIQVWRSETGEDGTQVIGNRVSKISDRAGGTGQNGNCINVFRAGNVLVANNRVSDCAFSGIRNNSGPNVQIIGNSISRAREVALYVEFAFEGAVVANNLIEDVAFGISITNFDQGGRLAACTGNVVRNVKGGIAGGNTISAVAIHAEADTLINDNVIENAAERGISMGWGGQCRNLSAVGNVIRDCKIGITPSVTEGSGAMLIANNIFEKCKTGIQGFDFTDAKTDDLADAGAKLPKHLIVKDNIKR